MEVSEYIEEINKINLKESKPTLNLTINKEEFQKLLKTKYENSKHIVKSTIIDEMIEQQNIKYLIKYLKIDNTKNKPILIDKKEFKDPFAPPLAEDMIVSDNFCNFNFHRILFTKFPLFKEQVLLVSRDFLSQYTHLTIENIRDLLYLIYLIDGFGFFNGGMKAGASQPRKHLQAAPYSSLPERDFGIFKHIKNNDNLEQIDIGNVKYFNAFTIKDLNKENIKHILFKFDDELIQANLNLGLIEFSSIILLNIYKIGLKFLNIDEKNEKIENDYSLLITENFMFLTTRKAHEVFISEKDEKENNFINLNSLAFFFIIVSRSPEQIEEMKKGNIIKDVLSKL